MKKPLYTVQYSYDLQKYMPCLILVLGDQIDGFYELDMLTWKGRVVNGSRPSMWISEDIEYLLKEDD